MSIRQPGIIQVRIPQLPEANLPLTGDELVWLTQLGASVKAKTNALASLIVPTAQDWVYKSTTYTAVTGNRIAADTSGGPWTLMLPVASAVGEAVEVADPKGTFATNNLTVASPSQEIEGVLSAMVCDFNRVRVVFVFDGVSWRVFS